MLNLAGLFVLISLNYVGFKNAIIVAAISSIMTFLFIDGHH